MVDIRTAAGASVAALLLLAGCTGRTDAGTSVTASPGSTAATSAPISAGPTDGATAAPTPNPAPSAPASKQALPIYYVADTAAGLRLYREFHAVPTADPPSDAVRELLAQPAGIDPDYRSHWPAGTQLRSAVTHTGGVITVDLSSQARTAQLGSELAELTVQQLVYTVQGALQSTDPVRLLIDGATVPELWGHVSTAQPVQRADPYRTRSLVQIDNPAHGAQVGRTFTVSGEASSFEANVPWQVLRDGTVIRSGHTMAGSTQFDSFSFSLTLEPGDYTVRITDDNACGDECRAPFEDTKLVHVVG
jgi:Sporulation and spore germination/Immunoglobulin-like domain of bacterial spore germination